jgi:hypothetical protein
VGCEDSLGTPGALAQLSAQTQPLGLRKLVCQLCLGCPCMLNRPSPHIRVLLREPFWCWLLLPPLSKGQVHCGDLEQRHTGHRGNSAGSNVLLCGHRLSGLESKGRAQRTRGLTLYTLASRLQKQKPKFNPYMVACNSIGYAT